MRLVLSIALLHGCDPTADGTSVGNPNKTLLRIAPGGEVALSSAELRVVDVVVDGVAVSTPSGTDVLAGVELDLPRELTSVTLSLDGTFDLSGMDGDAIIDLKLDVPEVRVTATRLPFELGQPHVFELADPGWLSAERAGWVRGEDQLVRPGDTLHDGLAAALERSRLLLDADEDGIPDGR